MAVRHRLDGHHRLVAALRTDPTLMQQARQELARCAELERAGRLDACWISRLARTTLTAALAAANQPPVVPAGARDE